MKSASKKIVRASKESAENAMAKHIDKMKVKGWEVDKEFGDDCGCRYECVTWFFKDLAMAQTSTQRSQKRRDRLEVEKLAEVRGIIAPPSKHAEIKDLVRKAMMNKNEGSDNECIG